MAITLFQTSAQSPWSESGEWRQNSSWGGTVGDSLELPASLRLESTECSFRSRSEERGYLAGSFVFGEEWDEREITVEGEVYAATHEDLRALERAIKAFAGRPNLKLKYDADQYINLSRLRGKVTWDYLPQSGKTMAMVRLRWLCGDPFWYATDLVTQSVSLTGDDTIPVTVSAGSQPVHPVFTFTVPSGGDLTDGFGLEQTTDDGMNFEYADPATDVEDVVVTVDCEQQTVSRDGTNSLRYFQGELLRLLPGMNTLTYTGPAVDFALTYRPRWI